jgi:hypothetical protein
MKEDKEILDSFKRAEGKLKNAILKHPLEMLEISTIIENSDDYKSEDVNNAFARLYKIIYEIR